MARDNGSTIVEKRILELVSPINESGKNENSPLHDAVFYHYAKSVKALIAKVVDVNARNLLGSRPLYLASRYLEIVNILIKNGADINCHNLNGRNPLHEAYRSSNTSSDIVMKLLKAGATTEYMDNDKNTLLHNLLIGKNYEIVEKLLEM